VKNKIKLKEYKDENNKKLNKREITLLNKIGVNIEDIKKIIVLEGEISNMDKNENPTALSEEYSELA
jgi:DNA-binding transcriptional MerR regulator